MGVWRPVSGVLAKFTSHLQSPELGALEVWLAPLDPHPPPPTGPGVPCGSSYSSNT